MSHSEIAAFLAEHPEVSTVELLISDLNGVIRGKRIERDLLEKVFTEGFSLPGSVMALDATGTTVEETGLGADDGDRDRLCLPVPGSLAPVPWQGPDRAQALFSMFETDGATPFAMDPRQVLVAAIERFNRLGYTPGIAVELEFYLIDTERTAEGGLQPPMSPTSGRRMSSKQVYSMDDLDEYDFFIRDVIDTARAQNIPGRHRHHRIRPGPVRGQPAPLRRPSGRRRPCRVAQARHRPGGAQVGDGSHLYGQALHRRVGQRHAHPPQPDGRRRP